MKDITHKTKISQFDEQGFLLWPAAKVATIYGHKIMLNIGASDDIHFILHDGYLLIMSVNSRYGSAGITVFDPVTMDVLSDFFTPDANDKRSLLYGRRDFFGYTWYTQARKLYDIATNLSPS